MAFTQLINNLNIIQALDRNPNTNNGLSYTQLQAKFDEAAGLIKTYLNSTLLTELASTTDGSAGADNIGATAITNLTGTTVQALLESLRNNLKATTDGASGADFVNATAIAGLTGTTVQALLEAIKAALDTHKSSSDHDGRYYTETELNNGQLDTRYFTETELSSTTDNTSGADKIGATAIATSPTTVQGILEWLKTQLDNVVLGQVPDGSMTSAKIADNAVTNAKLATDVKVGSLTSLTTTSKASVVGAINEHDTEIGTLSSLTTTAKSSLVAAVNELDSDLATLSTSTTTHQNDTSLHTTVMTTQGDMIYRGASSASRLAKGTAYQGIRMNVAESSPEWGNVMIGEKQIFTLNSTFTAPKTGIYKVTVTGGGGGGGRIGTDGGGNSYYWGGGGGAGGTAIKFVSLNKNDAIAITVGAGGAVGVNAGNSGSSGGASSFGVHCSANGGSGGLVYYTSGSGGAGTGGTASSGDINISGGAGAMGTSASGGSTALSGIGGSSFWGGQGAYGSGNQPSQNGISGIVVVEW